MSNKKNTKEMREEINKIEMEIINLTERRTEILKTLAERAEKSESVKKASKDGKKILESREKKAEEEKKAFKLAEDIEFVKKSLIEKFSMNYIQGEGVSIENGYADPLFETKKDLLKSLGFRWSPKFYRWYVPANQWGAVAKKMRAVL